MTSRAALLYLTFNSEADIPHLESLVALAGQDLPVVAVDNASSDGSVAALKELGLEPHIEEQNLGFTAGINEGLVYLVEQDDYDWAVIANPDVRAQQKDWLAALLDVPAECGIVGARLINGYKVLGGGCVMGHQYPLIRPQPRGCSDGIVMCDELLGWSRISQRVGGPHDFTQARDVPWVAFSLAALRLDMVRRIGLLNEDYWHFVSDQEYCLRAWSHGYSVRYQPVIFLHPGNTCLRHAPPLVEQLICDDLSRWCKREPEYLRASMWA